MTLFGSRKKKWVTRDCKDDVQSKGTNAIKMTQQVLFRVKNQES